MSESIVILGCSRGLGASIFKVAPRQEESLWLLVSRKENSIQQIKLDTGSPEKVETLSLDLANGENYARLVHKLEEFKPTRIFYIAGGGPYGKFESKNWRDHQWAFEVNLLGPAKLLHWAMNIDSFQLKQLVFVGSAIAEESADPMSSSYAAAKHGLKGLYSSIRVESPKLDIRLFSPGYMDTELLPPNSTPRRDGQKLICPDVAANVFWNWVLSDDLCGHFRYL